MFPFRLSANLLVFTIIGLVKTELSSSKIHGAYFDSSIWRLLNLSKEVRVENSPHRNCSESFMDGKYEYVQDHMTSANIKRGTTVRVLELASYEKENVDSGGELPGWPRLVAAIGSLWQRMFPSDSQWHRRLLRALDRAIRADSVRISDGIFLVKDDNDELGRTEYEEGWSGEGEWWGVGLIRRIILLLETHAVRVRMGTMATTPGEEGRIGGHGYRHAFPMMVGSFALLAAFFVPLGFQLLAVVAGKALVLSQIAILVAMGGSIQRYFGLRGSNYNYGPPQEYHHHHLGGGGGDSWHRGEDSNPGPLQTYFNDKDNNINSAL